MTWEILFMLFLLVVILTTFVWERIPVELTAMSAFALLLVLGLLPTEEAMAVFSNPGPIAVGAMFILSAALEKCGAIDMVAAGLARIPVLKLWVVMPGPTPHDLNPAGVSTFSVLFIFHKAFSKKPEFRA